MFLKRIFDILASFLGLLILWPLLLVAALLIKFKTLGAVLFTQKRVGWDGKLFTVVKFRTMLENHNGSSISVKGESRITPLVATLRKYKLDELPELWNVLKGDMSFVGPRPDVPDYADKLTGDELKILKLRPGITGPASLKYEKEEELLAQQGAWNNAKKYEDKVVAYGKKKCGNRLFFLGKRDDVPELYGDMDIAVHPSHSENLGGAGESLLLEVPTIASNLGGFPDIAINEKTGLLVSTKNPEKLANAIEKIIQKKIDIDSFKKSGRALCEQFLDVKSKAKTMADIYYDIAKQNTNR